MSSLSNIKSKSGSATQSHKEKVINYESLKREKDEKIQMLRDSHTNETPSIYIQNSHSHHLWDCKKLEKNYLLIMIGAGGVGAVGDHELLLQDPIVRKLLTLPIITKEDMDERLFQLRDFFPMLTFHYSNYFGIKPINDKKRKKCKYNTTESYFDIDYADAAIFPDDNCESRRMGLTTLEQFQGKYKVCNTESYEIMDSLDINFFDSLDISNYHILSKLNLLNGEFIINDIEIIKKIMPYLDVSKFNNIRELRDTFDEKDETMKLSELMKINGPGIYIHYACRPFVHKEGDSNNFVRSNNENGSIEYRHLRQNSENTLIAANCPIRTDIVARGYLNIISGLYRGCENIKHVLIAKEVTKIDYGSFEMCFNLKEVKFEEPSSLTYIGERAFKQCRSLTRIEIPDSVTNIENYAFEKCRYLKHIKFSKNIEILKRGICNNSENLEEVILPEKLIRIEHENFSKTKIKNIELPPTLEYIGCHVFSECKYLTEINLPDSVTELGRYVFNQCENLQTVRLSDNIEVIRENTFEQCKKLKNINIPNKLNKIEQKAFYNCESLESITFPNKIIKFEIQSQAFFGCTNLKNVYINRNAKINASLVDQKAIHFYFNENCNLNIISVQGINRTQLKLKPKKSKNQPSKKKLKKKRQPGKQASKNQPSKKKTKKKETTW